MLEAAIEACEMISEESRASLDSDRKLIQVAEDHIPTSRSNRSPTPALAPSFWSEKRWPDLKSWK